MNSTELIQLICKRVNLLYRAIDPDYLVKGFPGVINIMPENDTQWQMTVFCQGTKIGLSGVQDADGKLLIKECLCTNRKDIILQRTADNKKTIKEILSPLDILPDALKKCLDTTRRTDYISELPSITDIFNAGKELLSPIVDCPDWKRFNRMTLQLSLEKTTVYLISPCRTGKITIRAVITELGAEDVSVRLYTDTGKSTYIIHCTDKQSGKPSVEAALQMDEILSTTPVQKKITLSKPKPTAK